MKSCLTCKNYDGNIDVGFCVLKDPIAVFEPRYNQETDSETVLCMGRWPIVEANNRCSKYRREFFKEYKPKKENIETNLKVVK